MVNTISVNPRDVIEKELATARAEVDRLEQHERSVEHFRDECAERLAEREVELATERQELNATRAWLADAESRAAAMDGAS